MKGRRGEAAAKGGKSIAESFRSFRARLGPPQSRAVKLMTRVSLSVS